MDYWDEMMLDFIRRGQGDKKQFLESELKKSILPSQLARIQQNDKTVLKELILPEWLNWDLLFEWGNRQQQVSKGVECILCNSLNERGKTFNGKFVCEECVLKLKSMP